MSGNQQQQQNQQKTLTTTTLTAAVAAAATTNGTTTLNNNLIKTNSVDKIISKTATQAISKQQQQQQQQQLPRRSLLPPTAAATLQQQQQTVPHSTQQQSVTTAGKKQQQQQQSHQLQTVATIHQPHSTQQQQQQQQQQQHHHQTLTSRLPIQQQSTKELPNLATHQQQQHQQQHQRRSFYQLQQQQQQHSLRSPNLKAPAPAHSIPPRYQPPPQPGTGILKPHLPIKYPPDIPQLSNIYIPDSLKQQQQQQHPQQTRYLQHPAVLKGGAQDMLKFVRKPEQEHPSPNASVTSSGTGIPTANGGGRLTVEQNRQLQSLVNELRTLKEQNQRLLDDNQELRDLCCFLDDDRQKGRKLAREWQRFGRYTASVMRQEVAAYQNKLRQLDDKQQELITDNLELKELCLYLDEERAHVAANALCAGCGAATRNALRDDGDGSSSSTQADETITALRNYAEQRQLPQDLRHAHTLNDQTLQYVRSLERRIQQLEEERTTPTAHMQQPTPTPQAATPTPQPATATAPAKSAPSPHQQEINSSSSSQQQAVAAAAAAAAAIQLPEPIAGRPEAVVRALQVLEVREQLERDRLGNLAGSALDQMDDGEKALVREMCNVVWRKLEGSPHGPAALEPL
ncbi:mediator of RNA polymerase II transcription subunit 15 [Drosophila pseudoobscura]|uniref:Mediator of RNA polymerase II transcription subunit 15 n=1 Tax=Drosophila pseudoobscura pseudoobscura TaxID=46245 RepID=A0A6I8UXQ6_DROPS|nr:mediator of RNA polymerase II transcription subunit 15 [Drosophila pseudoobscura]XP_015036237.2 mediator of RNA polymerase II transcription subunit 15 [Drosophila pseudoobscura]